MNFGLLSTPDKRFRESRPGLEKVSAGYFQPRHAHLKAYATVIVEGAYGHAGYFGRRVLEPGDVLVTPILDRHENHVTRRRHVQLLRFEWNPDTGLGGVYRPAQLDTVIQVASRDPVEARQLLQEMLLSSASAQIMRTDWPDLLARQLRAGRTSITDWAAAQGLARETVSRGFHKTYGVSPRAFASELQAREAWIRIVDGSAPLVQIANDLGYADQPHMTRSVSALTGLPPGAWRRMRNQTYGESRSPADSCGIRLQHNTMPTDTAASTD